MLDPAFGHGANVLFYLTHTIDLGVGLAIDTSYFIDCTKDLGRTDKNQTANLNEKHTGNIKNRTCFVCVGV